MSQTVCQMFRFLRQLIDSCADYEVMMDTLVTPADPGAYHAAWEGISGCISRISESGMTPDQIVELVLEPSCGREISGILDPLDLVPLMGAGFGPEEKVLFRKACQEWVAVIEPSDQEEMTISLSATVRKLNLADILSPEITRMQRLPTVILLQGWENEISRMNRRTLSSDSTLVPPYDDPAGFCGRIHQGIFCHLVQKRILPEPLFPDLVLQAIGDFGIIGAGGIEALRRHRSEEGPDPVVFFESGRNLFRDAGRIRDIRTLYRTVSGILEGEGKEEVAGDLQESLAGHVLAGFAYASRESGSSSGLAPIVAFVRSVASRRSGRADPGPDQLRDLDQTVQEIGHLLRVLTDDYSWRTFALPPRTGSFFAIDILPDRHLLQYDPGSLVYKSREASLSLAMESLYRSWFGIRPPVHNIPELYLPWFARLAAVVGTRRAVRKGLALHPGAAGWLENFALEEYDDLNRRVFRKTADRLSLPDQFLFAALAEARTGIPQEEMTDISVRQVLAATRWARREIEDPFLPDDACITILRDDIWPACAPLFAGPDIPVTPVTTSPARTRAREHRLAALGTTRRDDAAVPSPYTPSSTMPGKVIAGEEQGLMDDDEFSLSSGPPGQGGTPAGAGRAGKGGAPSLAGGSRSPGQNASGPGGAMSGIAGLAAELMEACQTGKGLLDDLGKKDDTRSGDEKDPIIALRENARRIDELAGRLEEQLAGLRASGRPGAGGDTTSPDAGDSGAGEEWDTLLKLSEEVRNAACTYREAMGEIAKPTPGSGPDHDATSAHSAMTREALSSLLEAGAEFQKIAGLPEPSSGDKRVWVRVPDGPCEGKARSGGKGGGGQADPSFAPDAIASEEFWENLAYFDATFGDEVEQETSVPEPGRIYADTLERRYEQGELALTREAEQYLSLLRQRTRSEWETMDEKAEQIRRVALFESLAVGEDDYTLYQRFYQPVAGLVGVARKNIQQALQKNRATRDLNELTTGDDIDEENLAAVRTTMRIFRDQGRQPDQTRWTLSLLIDVSSSMHDESVAKKLEATLRTAILFGDAVSHIGEIQFEIAAFADSEYIPLKRYTDEWNIHQGCYLIRQVIQASGGTNDVGAVSSALDRMHRFRLAAGTSQLIFVITDGQSGVGGRDQLRQMLAGHKKTRIFGWGVGPDMEKVEETYRPYGTWVPDIADLPRSLGETLRRELGRPAMAGWQDDRSGQAPQEDICTT
jgi:hypothetical protein